MTTTTRNLFTGSNAATRLRWRAERSRSSHDVTASDFGRTLASNGDGSDHGWGAHHFVVGGAVKGRDIYGQFPAVALGTNEDAGQGRLIPTTSVDQYAASFARWMGLSDTQLADVLPNLQYFSPATLPLFA